MVIWKALILRKLLGAIGKGFVEYALEIGDIQQDRSYNGLYLLAYEKTAEIALWVALIIVMILLFVVFKKNAKLVKELLNSDGI